MTSSHQGFNRRDTEGGPEHPRLAKQRFFICCDGTWQDGINNMGPLTNVAQLARYLSPVSEDGFRQIVYYDSGVGNTNALFAPAIDAATGRGISAKIKNAYSFLSHNYNFIAEDDPKAPTTERRLSNSQEDEIVLVGFSRGAFTVQCLASLISDIGLLHKDSLQYLRYIFALWANQELSSDLKDRLKQNLDNLDKSKEIRRQTVVKIKALAAWDMVSALAFSPINLSPKPLSFVEKKLPNCVQNAFHALALNENRGQFKPCVWSKSSATTEQEQQETTTVKQCWFLGSHSDIGGGNKDSGLATISFIWMVSQLKSLGVSFDPIDPTRLISTNRLQLDYTVNRFWGKFKAHLSIDRKVLSLGKTQQAGKYWYILGIERRAKYLESEKTEAGHGEEGSHTGQETHDRAHQQQEAANDNLTSKSMSSTLIHFSVRVRMGKELNTCRILGKWKTQIDEIGKKRVFWEREKGHGLGAKEAKLRLFEDVAGQHEWDLWLEPGNRRKEKPPNHFKAQEAGTRRHPSTRPPRMNTRQRALGTRIRAMGMRIRAMGTRKQDIEKVCGDSLFGDQTRSISEVPNPGIQYKGKRATS